MDRTLFNWILSLPGEFAKFGSWLTTPLPNLNISPLAIFGLTGLTIIVGFLIVRLVVGG